MFSVFHVHLPQALAARNTSNNMKRVVADLTQVKEDNASLKKALKAASS